MVQMSGTLYSQQQYVCIQTPHTKDLHFFIQESANKEETEKKNCHQHRAKEEGNWNMLVQFV